MIQSVLCVSGCFHYVMSDMLVGFTTSTTPGPKFFSFTFLADVSPHESGMERRHLAQLRVGGVGDSPPTQVQNILTAELHKAAPRGTADWLRPVPRCQPYTYHGFINTDATQLLLASLCSFRTKTYHMMRTEPLAHSCRTLVCLLSLQDAGRNSSLLHAGQWCRRRCFTTCW